MLTACGDTDELMSHGYPDAMSAAAHAFHERVKQILTADQLTRWDSGSFDGVFGRRLPILPPDPQRDSPWLFFPAPSRAP
jgi:hypothetical protein